MDNKIKSSTQNLPKETVQLIKRYRTEQLRLQIANGDRWQNTGYLFTQDNGLPIHPDSITGWLDRFAKRNGLPISTLTHSDTRLRQYSLQTIQMWSQ